MLCTDGPLFAITFSLGPSLFVSEFRLNAIYPACVWKAQGGIVKMDHEAGTLYAGNGFLVRLADFRTHAIT